MQKRTLLSLHSDLITLIIEQVHWRYYWLVRLICKRFHSLIPVTQLKFKSAILESLITNGDINVLKTIRNIPYNCINCALHNNQEEIFLYLLAQKKHKVDSFAMKKMIEKGSWNNVIKVVLQNVKNNKTGKWYLDELIMLSLCTGNIEILDILVARRGVTLPLYFGLHHIAHTGHVSSIKWMEAHKLFPPAKIKYATTMEEFYFALICRGHFDAVQYIWYKYAPLPLLPKRQSLCDFAGENSNSETWESTNKLIVWLYENRGIHFTSPKVCVNICATGNIEMLKWARRRGAQWNIYCYHAAGLNNHIPMLKWLYENGCPIEPDVHVFNFVLLGCDIETIKYMTSIGIYS